MDEMIKKMVSQMNRKQVQHLIKKLEAEQDIELQELIIYLRSIIQ